MECPGVGGGNRAVIEKIAAVFESYWQQPDFEPYNRDGSATTRDTR